MRVERRKSCRNIGGISNYIHFVSTKGVSGAGCAFTMKTALLLFASLGFGLVARAESPDSIPNPRQTNRSSIYDGARVLNDSEKHRIDDAINTLENKTKAQMMVVTVQTLDGESIEDWSNALFRRIGIGRKGKDDGVLFVFAIKDRKSRVEVGLGLEDRLTDARATAILREQVNPAFRRGAFGEGILDGVQVAANYVEGGTRPTPRPTVATSNSSSNSGSRGNSNSGGFPSSGSSPSTSYSPPSNSGGGGGGGGILLLLGVLVAGGVGTAVYMGTRPRRCPRCKAAMTETAAPDSDLTDAEQLERHMGSRSFQRCTCPKCGYSDIEKKDSMFSGVDRCSRCGNRTARTQTRTLSDATYDYGGVEEITEICEYPPCRHVERRTRTTPRRTPSSAAGGFAGGFSSSSDNSSSSSSGGSYDGGSSSSYGGGDSGGGGGSSSW
ncbi:TPM domain-containing protein [bacterium]|nr:MAG: TPM domain-containing protein [bacterium]